MISILNNFLLLITVYNLNVYYTINLNSITVKFPFIKGKKISIDSITGWIILTEQTGKEIIFYFKQQNQKKQNLKIALSGKKLKDTLHEFIKLNYEKVKLKNIEQLKESGFKFKLDNKNYCLIKKDKIEISNRTYKSYYWNEIKNIT